MSEGVSGNRSGLRVLAGLGLLGELMVRTYYESSGKRGYTVREVLE